MATSERSQVTVPDLARKKSAGEPIAVITAYDAFFAGLFEEAGVDAVLVGDSLGMVVQGAEHTLGVSLEEMAYHVRIVAAATRRALVIGDLPFGSYHTGAAQAVASAVTLVKAGAQAVKLEGGQSVAATIDAITRLDIPVIGHIGLTPQSYHRMGGHRVQGRSDGFGPGGRGRILDDAVAVEGAGASAIVLEGIPRSLAREIRDKLTIPTIGIGAGPDCDGQVLVMHDVLGLTSNTFTFTKHFGELRTSGLEAVGAYIDDVRSGRWPDDEHSFH